MQSVYVFLDIAKFVEFLKEDADVSRNQEVCYVIRIFFRYSLGKVQLFQVS